jgi:hypothetical protein
MTLDLPSLLQLAWTSIRTPRDGARAIKSVVLPRASRWEALLLIVVISVFLAQVSTYLVTGQATIVMGPFLANPIMACIIQMSLLIIMVFAIYWIGRAMGGSGSFEDAILLVAWMQFVMVCLQAVQTVALLVMPPLASLIGVAGLGLFFWLLTNFIAELHGFRSLGRVFLMVIASIFGIAFGLSLILSLIGISVPGTL